MTGSSRSIPLAVLRPPSCAYNRARGVPWQDNLKLAWKGAPVEDARSGHNVIAGVDGDLDYGFVQAHLNLGELFNQRVCWRIGIQ
jgi:hypothetical protein